MLSSHLRLGLPSGLLPWGLPTKTPVNTSPLPHACYMSHPPQPPWLNHLNNIRRRIQAVKFILCNFLHDPSSSLRKFKFEKCALLFGLETVLVPSALQNTKYCKGEGKVVPVLFFKLSTTPWRRIEEWRFSSTHSLVSALDGGEWSASRPGRFTPSERAPGNHWIGGWVGPRAVLDAVVERKIPSPRRESNPRTPIVQPVA
jgi:hypothetical protein